MDLSQPHRWIVFMVFLCANILLSECVSFELDCFVSNVKYISVNHVDVSDN